MDYSYFIREEVLTAMETDGYFIHTHTSNSARTEANRLCRDLSEHFNNENDFDDANEQEEKITILNSEVPPSCNYGVIKRSDQFPSSPLREDMDEKSLMQEIERSRKK